MRTLIALLLALAVDRWPLADNSSSANGQQPTANQFNVSFSMRGDRARGWPVKTKISLLSQSTTKEWTVEASDARRPLSVRVPPGAYRLTIAAEHHRLYQRTLEVDKDISLPEIALAA